MNLLNKNVEITTNLDEKVKSNLTNSSKSESYKEKSKQDSSVNFSDEKLIPSIKKNKNLKKREGRHFLSKRLYSENPSASLFLTLLGTAVIMLFIISAILIALLAQIHNIEIQTLSTLKNITVSTTPDNADIYLDNVYKGISPLTLDKVNISETRVLRIRKVGYQEVIQAIDKNNFQSSYNITLVGSEPAPLSLTDKKSFSDIGINLVLPSNATITSNIVNSKCKYLKNSIVDKKKCPTDDTALTYTSYIINIPTSDGSYTTVNLRPATLGDFCVTKTDSVDGDACHIVGAQKDGASKNIIKILNQDINLVETSTILYATPNIKSSGSDYNNFYIQAERSNPAQFSQILSTISKNA